MPPLSAFIITKNEAVDIEACLKSLSGLADEIVVVDDESTDATVEICKRLGAKVFHKKFDGFGPQKQFALEQTTGEWVLSIDADERVPAALAEEIRRLMGSQPKHNGYKIRRNFYFLGRHLRFGGLGKDWVLRLFRKNQGRFRNVKVHESIDVSGTVGRLRNPLEHYSYPTLEEYRKKRDQYTTLAAQEQWAKGRRFSWRDHFRPAWELGVRVIAKGAWLDGQPGITYAALSAGATWLRAVKLRELSREPHPLTPLPMGEGRTSRSYPLPSGEGRTKSGVRQRILIVRTDRLGDVLLTTPVSRLLREKFPAAHIAWLVQPYTAPLLENNPDVDEIIVDQGGSADALAARLREGQFDTAIVAFPRWRTVRAVWRAGIPVRIGPASKIYSLLLNRRVWQHRSEGKRHEADYNLELLAPLGIPFQRVTTRFVLTPEEKTEGRGILESYRISFKRPIVCLHPGSGGSSARWPLNHFMELGDRLQEAGCDVVVTGGPGETHQTIMIDQMKRVPVFIAAGSISTRQFASILSHVDLMVSNSTGPLHMAVALGTPTVSVYSPIPTCHPRRWGPYPAYVEDSLDHSVFMPPVTEDSSGYMADVRVDTVFESCKKKLELRRGIPVA
jgi:ADP-heptose:LPS heptosyltransferase